MSNALYAVVFDSASRTRETARLAERLILFEQAIQRLPPVERDVAAHALASGPIDVDWSSERLVVPGEIADADASSWRQHLAGC